MSGGGKTGGKGGGSAKIGSTKAGSARVPGKQAPKSAAGGGGSRDLRVKVKKAGKLKHSSQLWLERQLNDPYVKRARELGYRSRAAFKLEEMDDRFRFLKPGQKLIDLGCAPGGWCQIAAARIGLDKGKGRIVGIDLLPVDPIPGVELIEMDFMAEEAPALLTERLGGRADGVMSDMAAKHHRPQEDRPHQDHRARRGCARFRPFGAGARRLLPRQAVPGRRQRHLAGGAQARLHHRAQHQAGLEPRRFLGTLCAGDRVPSEDRRTGRGRGLSQRSGSGAAAAVQSRSGNRSVGSLSGL